MVSSCLIVGAGLSGLLAARTLRARGVRVTVLDKGRQVGGRLATRSIHDGVFDYGAQFFTIRSETFSRLVDKWLAQGIVEEWSRGFAEDSGTSNNDGHPRYRGVNGMNGIARHLGRNIVVRCNYAVRAVSRANGKWIVRGDTGETFGAQSLLLTPPVPQSLALLDAGRAEVPPSEGTRLEAIEYEPCLALMAVTESQTAVPDPGGIRFREGPIAWLADNARKGISPGVSAVTIHACPEFSRRHWETSDDAVASLLFQAADPWIRSPIRSFGIHRWRYSQPIEVYPSPCLMVDGDAPLVFAGDAFGGPRIEGAALSGLAAAEALLGGAFPRAL